MAKRKAKKRKRARVVTRRYDLHLKDTAPTTDLERAVYKGLPLDERFVWCPIREQQLDVVVCSRLQNDHRPRCRRVGCGNLDTEVAKTLRKARRRAEDNDRSAQSCMKFG